MFFSRMQIVNAIPYPMMLLAFDLMLDNLVWFCTVTGNFSVLSDPTFSLGDLWQCIAIYCWSLETSTHWLARLSPLTIFSPHLLHQKLLHLKCCGSDGEAALVNAFSAVFPDALHLCCFLHFCGNIVRKLQELNILPATSVKCYENVKAAQHKHLRISAFGVYVWFDCACVQSHPCLDWLKFVLRVDHVAEAIVYTCRFIFRPLTLSVGPHLLIKGGLCIGCTLFFGVVLWSCSRSRKPSSMETTLVNPR